MLAVIGPAGRAQTDVDTAPSEITRSERESILSRFVAAPNPFVENRGQVGEPVRFTLSNRGSTLFVLDDAFLWHFPQDEEDAASDGGRSVRVRSVALTFEGADPAAEPRGTEQPNWGSGLRPTATAVCSSAATRRR